MKARWTKLLLATVAAGMITFAATPAMAQTSNEPDATPPTTLGSGDHCSLNLDTNVMVCANTERALPEAVQNLTGFTQLDATQQAAAKGAATTLTTYVIGAIYDGVSYGGASLNITTSGTCATGQYNYYDLGAIGWDDRISSFRSYAGCRTSLWENINETGAKYGPYGSLSAIGIMNNNASSIRWAA